MAFLNRGIRIIVIDNRNEEVKREEYSIMKAELLNMLNILIKRKTPITPEVIFIEGKGRH